MSLNAERRFGREERNVPVRLLRKRDETFSQWKVSVVLFFRHVEKVAAAAEFTANTHRRPRNSSLPLKSCNFLQPSSAFMRQKQQSDDRCRLQSATNQSINLLIIVFKNMPITVQLRAETSDYLNDQLVYKMWIKMPFTVSLNSQWCNQYADIPFTGKYDEEKQNIWHFCLKKRLKVLNYWRSCWLFVCESTNRFLSNSPEK